MDNMEITNLNNEAADLNIFGEIADRTASFCTFTPETPEEKIMFFNAINSTKESVKEHVNEVIELKHIYGEVVKVTDENTGEIISIPRIVLISKDNVAYGCASFGIFNSIKKLIQIMGAPSEDNIYKIKIKSVKTRKGNNSALSFELVQ